MAPKLSGQTSKFGVLFFVSFGKWEKKETQKICNFDPKASEPCKNIDISNVAYWEHCLQLRDGLLKTLYVHSNWMKTEMTFEQHYKLELFIAHLCLLKCPRCLWCGKVVDFLGILQFLEDSGIIEKNWLICMCVYCRWQFDQTQSCLKVIIFIEVRNCMHANVLV